MSAETSEVRQTDWKTVISEAQQARHWVVISLLQRHSRELKWIHEWFHLIPAQVLTAAVECTTSLAS